MSTDPVLISKLEDSAAGRALQAAGDAPTMKFVDFTSTLVTNVFDTLTTSMIDQTRNYADMVASVAGTLEEFEAKTLGDPNEAAVNYLNSVVLPTYKGTATPALPQPPFSTTPTFSGNTVFLNTDVVQVYSGVTASISGTDKVFALDTSGSIPTADLIEFTKGLLSKQTRRTFEDLRALVALGVAYMDITNGTLKTSLTFHTDSVDSASSDSTTTTTNAQNASRNFAGNLSRRSSTSVGGKIAGFFLGRSISNSIGGSFSSSSSSSNLSVNVINEKKSAVTNLSVDIAGSMELQFRTSHFPAVTNDNSAG